MRIRIFILVLACWVQVVNAITEKADLYHWNNSSGLPGNHVFDFVQDDKGFLWIATERGLVRFDGQEFMLSQLPAAHDGSMIQKIFKNNHELIIATNKKKLLIYDIRSFEFTEADKSIYTSNKTNHKEVVSFLSGVKTVQTDTFKVSLKATGELSVGNTPVAGSFHVMYKDSSGVIWVGSSHGGFGFLDTKESKVTYVGSWSNMPTAYVRNIVEDAEGKIWFDMPLRGIGYWDPKEHQLVSVRNVFENQYLKNGYEVFISLLDYNIGSLFYDRSGNLWIGTLGSGMYRIRFKPQYFQFFKFDYRSAKGLSHENVSCPLATQNGDVWIGTWGGGVNICKKDNLFNLYPEVTSLGHYAEEKREIHYGQVYPLMEDRHGNIWMSSLYAGIYFISRKEIERGRYNLKKYNQENGGIQSNNITALYEDSKGIIWAGTNIGLFRFSPSENRFEQYFHELEEPDYFHGGQISMIAEDVDSRLWIGTHFNGILCWDRRNNKIKQYKTTGTTNLNAILCSVMLPNSSIWFGGKDGLIYFDPLKEQFLSLKGSVDLPSNVIESMLLGDDGRLWLGTDAGMVAFDPENHSTERFIMQGGVMSNSFTRGASEDKSGYLYFGSRNGLCRFHPTEFKRNTAENPVVITNVEIKGKDFRKDSKIFSSIFHGVDITYNNHLELRHDQNTIRLDYRLLNYSPDDIVEYEVFMDGESNSWDRILNNHKTYNNLRPGDYSFHVRQKGQLEETILKITILKPWWIQPWAVVLFIVVVIAVVLLIILWTNQRAREEEKKHQKEQYDRMRFRFFLNISHEIRTPLSLIMGGLERLKEKASQDEDNCPELDRIQRNTNRLLRMVNEILDLKKAENAEVKVNMSNLNLREFLASTTDAFKIREDKRCIELHMPENVVWIHTDRELLETILYNLLSNAIKYSPECSKIKVVLKCVDDIIQISVRDSGPGIGEEEQQLIFERFYQSENHFKGGSGIGLALSKHYVGLLGGTIEVESELGKGSTFILNFPLAELVEERSKVDEAETEITECSQDLPSIVIVDDQAELRTFIREIFEQEYVIFEACNGKKALALIQQKRPDLIISDVMMPEMDGFELSKAVRDDINLSHIPLILLTAKTGEQAQLKAFECSVDAFIPKPFNQKILKLRAQKLIEQRRQLVQKYGNTPEEKSEILATSKLDKEFLEKIDAILMEKLDDVEFSVEELASEMAISVSGLYRKIKSLTSKSPIEFVRIQRLKVAARLLKETSMSVSEISDATGFGTQKYFSKAFKKQFEISPLNYRKKQFVSV
ncbi:hybrid sensor histidine kinase/response regulator [Puteibacter caeruleilacunae]|nr:hybrid sensor histidine kinase/response regulator [Puteibacter caeruleilacunae]